MMKNKIKIFVAGHNGMVGSAIVRELTKQNYFQIITRTKKELDLTNQSEVANFFDTEKPDQVYLAAAKVGGIHANNCYPADFIYENLMIQSNIIHQSFKAGVKKLLFLGSSCIYPKVTKQPMSEDQLLKGVLEPTNEPYAIAKIAGIKMCESYNRQYNKSFGIDYRSLMPSNLYGPGDNYHKENSHVIPALIRKIYEAKVADCKEVFIWGSGTPKREFLYVDDLAKASVYVMNLEYKIFSKFSNKQNSHLNVGFGEDLSIMSLAKKIVKIIGFKGEIKLDLSKPDGTMQKLLDSSSLKKLGWKPQTSIEEGLKLAYEDFYINILK
jgi:GDP-L-fucose synthase